jgi:hypothetical protein
VGILQALIPTDAATAIAVVGLFATLVGASVALFNSWKAVQWKRAEFANNFIRDFNSNDELVFAGRCLDWQGGRLVLPEKLRPYMPDHAPIIEHDRRIFEKALKADLKLSEDNDPRIQIYRTSMDSFFSWLNLVASGLDRKLFVVADIEEVGYWVAKIESEPMLHGYIAAFGYKENVLKLVRQFRRKKNPYRDWHFITPDVVCSVRAALQSLRQQDQESDRPEHLPRRHASRRQSPEAGSKVARNSDEGSEPPRS